LLERAAQGSSTDRNAPPERAEERLRIAELRAALMTNPLTLRYTFADGTHVQGSFAIGLEMRIQPNWTAIGELIGIRTATTAATAEAATAEAAVAETTTGAAAEGGAGIATETGVGAATAESGAGAGMEVAGGSMVEAAGLIAAPVLGALAHAFIFMRGDSFGRDFSAALDHAQWELYSFCASYVRGMRGLPPLAGADAARGWAAARHDLGTLRQRHPNVTEAALQQAARARGDSELYGSIFNRVESSWRTSLNSAASGAPGAPTTAHRLADESVDAMRPGGFGYNRHAGANPMQ
jgi:hypothetical protein